MKYKHFLYSIGLFLVFTTTIKAQQTTQRQKINFDADWKFHLGNSSDPAKDFNYGIAALFAKAGKAVTLPTAVDKKFNDSAWRTVQLPHDWAVELPFVNNPNEDVMAHGYKPVGGLFPETSIGWYRKSFKVNAQDSGKRFVLQFDGVFRDSKVWINGIYAGNNFSGYLGASYDVTDYIDYAKENVITVRVDATQYEGWFYEGAGIYRHVWLNTYNNLHIAENGVHVQTRTLNGKAIVEIETTVKNANLAAVNGNVYTYITDRNGNKLAQSQEEAMSVSINGSVKVKRQLTINDPKLWSVENPYLYRVVSVIKSNGKVVDTVSTRFGVRTIAFSKDGELLLNNKVVKIYGVNCHQDHAGVGSALPDYLQYYRICLLKEMGVNAYRTSHNAPTPELLDACDSLGMLVIDEQRLLNSSAEYLQQFERLIMRDRNHPSVFLWSIGNEEGDLQRSTVGKRIAQTLLVKQQQLDSTRTSTYAADLGNVYNGVNEVIPVRGFNYRSEAVEAYHNDHPGQPIIGTEMGSTVTTRGIYQKDSINAYVPDEDITHPWWSTTAETWWSAAADKPWWAGGFIWTGFDYRGEPTPYAWPNISSHFGVMDNCGFPKNIYYYYQSWWTDKDVLHVYPHWNWKGKEGQPINVWVNTNAESVELFLNGKSQGKKTMPRNKHLEWQVNYKPGVLEAVAYKNGRKIKTKVETTGDAYQIVLTPSKSIVTADGKDAVVVNVTVTDKEGREVPTANDLIDFTLTGNAEIIGVGNGDPSSHEADKFNNSRSLFNGKCQVIIQAKNIPGNIVLEAKSGKLVSTKTTVNAVK